MATRKKKATTTKTPETTVPLQKGIVDGQWGSQVSSNAVAPVAISNMVDSLTPIAAFELCSAVRAAVQARNQPFGQVKIRLFTKDGREIMSGGSFAFWRRPNGFQTGNNFLTALATWTDLSGERMSWAHDGQVHGKQRLVAHVLNPFKATVNTPVYPKFPEDILKWYYVWENGTFQLIDNDEVTFEHEINPSSLVRGNSKLISVVNSITASYESERYIKSFFANNAIPSGIVSLEGITNTDIIDPFKKEFMSQHKGSRNAHKLLFTAGPKVNFTALDQEMNEAPFQILNDNVTSKVMSIYSVPPLLGGQFDKVRFDSAEEQNNGFFESTWLPLNDDMQRYCQLLQDTKLLNIDGKDTIRSSFKMSKSLSNCFEKARAESQSDVVVVLDVDHIPSVAKLKQHKIDYAQKLVETFHITPAQAAVDVGMDIELNEAADMVWYKSDMKFIEPKKVTEPVAMAPVAPAAEPAVAPEPQVDVSEEQTNIKNFYRAFRKLSLESANKNSKWTLHVADDLAKQHNCKEYVHTEIRLDYSALSNMCKLGNVEDIKKHFNAKKPSYYKALALAVKARDYKVELITQSGACELCEEKAAAWNNGDVSSPPPYHPNCRCQLSD